MAKKKEKVVEAEFKPFYDKVINSSSFMNFITGLEKARIASALIYERVGNSEYFLGAYPLLRGKYHQIGEYYVIDLPKPYFVDCLGSEVFTPAKDKKIGKIVEFVKYSDDDYRVRKRIDDTFYTVEKRIKYSEDKVGLTDNNGEVITDDNGNPILIKEPVRDENGNIEYNEITRKYTEPKAVTQEGRDAIRVHNIKKQDIKKFKEENKGLWNKFMESGGLGVVALAIVGLLFIFGMKFISDSWSEGVASLTTELKDVSKNSKWWQQTDALDKIGQAVTQAQDEKNAPPTN